MASASDAAVGKAEGVTGRGVLQRLLNISFARKIAAAPGGKQVGRGTPTLTAPQTNRQHVPRLGCCLCGGLKLQQSVTSNKYMPGGAHVPHSLSLTNRDALHRSLGCERHLRRRAALALGGGEGRRPHVEPDSFSWTGVAPSFLTRRMAYIYSGPSLRSNFRQVTPPFLHEKMGYFIGRCKLCARNPRKLKGLHHTNEQTNPGRLPLPADSAHRLYSTCQPDPTCPTRPNLACPTQPTYPTQPARPARRLCYSLP